ncbi:hypothetical protein Tco_0144399 [Tanacetum coccineum]
METKDTLSLCSDSKEQKMQQIQDKAKESCMKAVKTESKEQDYKQHIMGNDAHADDADIRPIYDEEPMAEERESAIVKPHHVIASSESWNSSKNTQRFSLNDMVHNHYLKEATKRTQERSRNSRPSVMSSAKSQSTTNGSKAKPRSNTQASRN